jgi:hypothetical protein
MNYPVIPTEYQKDLYQPEWYERDFFYSPDGIQEFPDHHCKMTWLTSLPFIQGVRNAIDIGCRDGEYTRYLFNHFQHVYCFDPRFRKYFPFNVDLTKVTHFRIPLGDSPNPERLGRGTGKNMTDKVFYCLDDFNLQNIDYIKIDTDGYEMANIKGGLKTITRDWPVIVLEVFFERETLKYVTEELGYKIKAVCPRGWDHILIKE